MKLNFDLARTILLKIALEGASEHLEIPDHSQQEISEYIRLLDRAGLVEGHDISVPGRFRWQASYVTYEGTQFLADAREDSVWEKAKVMAANQGAVSLESLKKMLPHAAKELTLTK